MDCTDTSVAAGSEECGGPRGAISVYAAGSTAPTRFEFGLADPGAFPPGQTLDMEVASVSYGDDVPDDMAVDVFAMTAVDSMKFPVTVRNKKHHAIL